MGIFYEEITLINACDMVIAKRGFITEAEVHKITLKAVPDTGAWTLIINEELRQQLELAIVGTVESTMADGSAALHDMTESVEIRWQDRLTIQQAVVMPEAREVLLGALPLEGLDLYVDPVHQRLAGVHGEKPVYQVFHCSLKYREGIKPLIL